MSEENSNSQGQEETKKQKELKMLHHEIKDKLRSDREAHEKIWGRDSLLSCVWRAFGKLLLDMLSRSFAGAVFFANATYLYLQMSHGTNGPSEVILAILATMTATFALYWIEKQRGAQLIEAIIHRVRNGSANKF